MNNDDSTTIIAADYMYLIIIGDEKTMYTLVNKLNQSIKNKDQNIKNTKNAKNAKKTKNIKNNHKIFYIMTKIDIPCVEILDTPDIQNILIEEAKKSINNINNTTDEDINIYKKYIIFDEGVETAQCLTYAEGYKNNYMIMELINENTFYKLSFPILQLDEEVNPDELISSWIVDHDVSDVAKDLTIKPVNIVGIDHDILVFAACIND